MIVRLFCFVVIHIIILFSVLTTRCRPIKIKISVIITLKKDVLDPQGKVIHQTLDGMGFNNINEVRQGKYFEIDTKESDPKKATDKVEEMCNKLLANLVIENYKIIDAQ